MRDKMNPIGGCCLRKVFSLIKKDTQEEMLYFTSEYCYMKISYLRLLLPYCHEPWDDSVNTWKESGPLMTWLSLPHFRTSSDGWYMPFFKLVWGLKFEAFARCQKYLKVQCSSFYILCKVCCLFICSVFDVNSSESSLCIFKNICCPTWQSSHQLHVASEHLKCGYSEQRSAIKCKIYTRLWKFS